MVSVLLIIIGTPYPEINFGVFILPSEAATAVDRE
jgi:hypothetical protein